MSWGRLLKRLYGGMSVSLAFVAQLHEPMTNLSYRTLRIIARTGSTNSNRCRRGH